MDLTTVMPARRARWVIPAVVVVVGTAVVIGVALARPDPPPAATAAIDVPGMLTLAGDVHTVRGTTVCTGAGGYDDIAEGTPVTVTDASGRVVAMSALRAGRLNTATGACEFPWRADGIPAGGGFYGFEVGRRGIVRVAERDLTVVRLTLG